MTKLKTVVGFGALALFSLLSGGGIGALLYWRFEEPYDLKPLLEPKTLTLVPNQSVVVSMPLEQYTYLGNFSFYTTTLNEEGESLGSTNLVAYRKNQRYKMVTPADLKPGNFSVVLSLDYALNPLYRARGNVEFINIKVQPLKEIK